MGISTFEYNQLIKGLNKLSPINHNIKTFVPTPNYIDYRRGYIVRYFIQRVNDENATIYEVNSKEYEKYLTDEFWSSVSLEWRISGNLNEIEYSNKKSLTKASKKIKSLIIHLPFHSQFSLY